MKELLAKDGVTVEQLNSSFLILVRARTGTKV